MSFRIRRHTWLGAIACVLAACGSEPEFAPGEPEKGDAGTDATAEGDAGKGSERDASDGHDASDASAPDSATNDAAAPPLPPTCTSSAQCGANAECANDVCVCALSYRPCGGGCCAAVVSTQTIPGLWGLRASIALATDGTVYAAVRHDYDIADVGELWIRPPGGTFARSRTFADGSGAGAVCLTVRDDVAYLALANDAEVTVQRADGVGGATVIGAADLYDPRLGCVTAEDGTIWIAWALDRRQSTAVVDGVTIPRVGARTQFRHPTPMLGISELDVALDPTTQRPWAFIAHRSSQVLGTSYDLVDGADGAHRPSDRATIGAGSRIHSLAYTSHDSSLFSASIGGVLAKFNAPAALPASPMSSFKGSDVTLGPDGVPYIAGFDDTARRVFWYAGLRADSWSGAGYGDFPLVAPSHYVMTTAARAHDGAAAFLSLPSRSDLGAAVYTEIR